ncbi:MAG: MFS transporter [Rhodospirillaceae bacterium]|nr:MFS transporter [Rhodospirillaceae bacterium]
MTETVSRAAPVGPVGSARMTREERRVIVASSLGTVFEWYDFYLYGSLAAVISTQFFAGVNETAAFVFALLAFAAGFAVRPFGALVFGRIGDMVGRKYTFLVTIVIMGGATFAVGLLPNYAAIGVAAPIILIALRLLQGLALGGEYGGAAIYVAEHAPPGRRGRHTAWIQTTATVGLFLSLVVILAARWITGEAFNDWGWRIPFLLSAVLLGVSVWIRLKLEESPVFQRLKAEGKQSRSPLSDSFARWGNLKLVLIALFGAVAGQAVVWYTGQFYALFFLTQTLKVDATLANLLIAGSLILGTPFFLVFGAVSDRIGRKPIVLGGLALACLTYFPIFNALTAAANPALARAQAASEAVIVADPATCSFQFNPVGTAAFTTDCDKARAALSRASVSYRNQAAPTGSATVIRIGATELAGFDAASLNAAIAAAGYPAAADPDAINIPLVLALLTLLVIYVTMVYGPIAALLVEMFPARIRYTSMSLPYHIGNGWFGGFLPSVSFALVAMSGDIYYGLWYPVIIAAATFIIGALALPETHRKTLVD